MGVDALPLLIEYPGSERAIDLKANELPTVIKRTAVIKRFLNFMFFGI